MYPTPEHDIAHVPTKWIDLDETGKPRTDKATWVCRLEPEGWRVAGFAAYVFDGEDPLLLSFEDPDDMAKKQNWLKEEIDRRAKQETLPLPAERIRSKRKKNPRTHFAAKPTISPGKVLETRVSTPSCCREMINFFLCRKRLCCVS